MKNKERARHIAVGAVIASAYAAVTLLCGALGIGYGPVQFRISEALTVLPIFTPAAIGGLTAGCMLANLFSFNPIDAVIGTAGTLISALLTRALRNVKFKGLPVLSPLPPVIVNAVLVGFEIAWLYLPQGFSFIGFAAAAAQVGLGQLVVCYGLGIPLAAYIDKKRILF